jgi:acyl-CoA dehydrogenase
MDFTPSAKAQDFIGRLTAFMADEVFPVERQYLEQNRALNPGQNWTQWQCVPLIEELKAKAKAAGLWNLFLPDPEMGAGLTVLEYAPLAEIMGRSPWSAEIFNCNAPDTGNMEVLWHYGSDAQKERWLKPLLAGQIRSAFCMTEPAVASSDARNMAATITRDGDELVLDGCKWWSTGIGHPQARLAIFMGLSDSQANPHEQHSMVLVPLDAPGIRIDRMLPTFGEFDPPYGHGQITFDKVRVPMDNLLVGLGKGFAIAQGRLGPGRIHHCMRAIGAAERALELMIRRGGNRTAFGKPLLALDGNREKIADARIAIVQARLLTLFAAWKIQSAGVKHAMTEISAIKVVAPSLLQKVVDQAMQIHGGMGLTHDTVLSDLFLMARSLRYADGPDEVHRAVIAKQELKKYVNAA